MVREQVMITILFKIKWPNKVGVISSGETNKNRKSMWEIHYDNFNC